VSTPLPSFPHDAGEVIGLPSLRLLVAAFAGLALRLLAGPLQALLEDLADVFGVVANAEVALNQAGDTIRGPELVGPTMLLGPLQQESLQLAQLVRGEARGGTGVGLAGQTGLRARQTPPTMDGSFVDAEDARDRGGGLPVFDEFHSTSPPAF
jgi:hypothetical protein